MGEDMLLAFCRLLVLPVQLLFRRGVWQGLRRLSYGAFLVVFLGDLHGAGWNPVVFVGDASQAQIALLIGLMFLTGGLMYFGPAPASPTTHGSAGWAAGSELKGLLSGRRRALAPGALALAPYGRLRQLVLPPERATHHTLIVGPSGTGKTRSLFLPNAAWAAPTMAAESTPQSRQDAARTAVPPPVDAKSLRGRPTGEKSEPTHAARVARLPR